MRQRVSKQEVGYSLRNRLIGYLAALKVTQPVKDLQNKEKSLLCLFKNVQFLDINPFDVTKGTSTTLMHQPGVESEPSGSALFLSPFKLVQSQKKKKFWQETVNTGLN